MQLQLTYSLIEDRLLLTVQQDDETWGFWLTRRAALLLHSVLTDCLQRLVTDAVPAPARDWVLAENHQAVLQQGVLTQAPLAQVAQAPMLVYEVRFATEQGHAVIGLFNQSGEGKNFVLDNTALHGLLEMLAVRCREADWGHLPLPSSGLAVPVGATLQ